MLYNIVLPALVAELDAGPTGDQRVTSESRRGRQHSFVEIDHKNIFYSHSLPSTDSRRAVVSFWRKNVPNTG